MRRGLEKHCRCCRGRVRDGADWMPPAQLEDTLRAELGDDWRSRLASFEEVPVATASIEQVHRAVLDDGRPVAIKVQYPGALNGSLRSPATSHVRAPLTTTNHITSPIRNPVADSTTNCYF